MNSPLILALDIGTSSTRTVLFVLEKLGYPEPAAQVGRAVHPRSKYARFYAAEREKQRALEERG